MKDQPIPHSRDEFLNECWRQAVAAEKQNQMIDPSWVLVLSQELQHATRVALLAQDQLVELQKWLRENCRCKIA